MEITNIETIPGKTITTHYGLVCGSTVRSKAGNSGDTLLNSW